MTLSKIGRILMALVASAALGLGMTACGGGTIGYMWVLGTQYNQITAFKIDDYTGNLTQSPHSPFSSGGTNPQSIVLKAGGRFVYVINTGVAATVSTATGSAGLPTTSTQGNISEFSVGGDGVLTFQQNFSSQGTTPVWAVIDSTGSFLYVMDKYSPAYCGAASCTVTPTNSPNFCTIAGCTSAGLTIPSDLNGSITAFSIAADTGRLTLVTNLQQKVGSVIATAPNYNQQLTYFEVGAAPTMVKISSAGCMYALSQTSLYPLSVNSSTGQLTVPTTGTITLSGAANLSSINTTGSYVYVTDSTNNTIYPLTSNSTACSLSTVSPGIVSNLALTSHPVQSITSSNGKFLYVVNQSSTANPLTPANSTISAFTIDSNGALAPLADSANPYAIGAGPVCVATDPTNQYLYTSNNTDSTVTGKIANANTGILSDLSRGSVFPTTGKPSCMVISGNI
ncbi:Lactonase, 7-bladed beta-propeller [Granulicella rosea]|uniref:Lactonase, 7-bladed beta-propeller n=1 Tax=Granulicella rosea TaxID=474952 RepID=A0A239L8Z7_9BACT|nr:beta-propeller fold lactonase family protein [Granulicella rosea]SNT26004.1 Lactonase, 7-bladed beta-propeller [Granulicella rosea]